MFRELEMVVKHPSHLTAIDHDAVLREFFLSDLDFSFELTRDNAVKSCPQPRIQLIERFAISQFFKSLGFNSGEPFICELGPSADSSGFPFET